LYGGLPFLRHAPSYKPNSVFPVRRRCDVAGWIIIYLGLPSPAVSSGLPAPVKADHFLLSFRSETALLGLAPCGVYLATSVTRNAGGLLPRPFTHHLCLNSSGHRLVYSLLHLPSSDGLPPEAFPLGSTVPCGVRTFLPVPRTRSDDLEGALVFSNLVRYKVNR